MPGKSAVHANSTQEMEFWDKSFVPCVVAEQRQAAKDHTPLLPSQKCLEDLEIEKVLSQQPQDTKGDVLAAQAKARWEFALSLHAV